MFLSSARVSLPQDFSILIAWSEMVDEVLQHVHLVGGDVVEGDGAVAAAGHPLLHRVEDVFLVPEVIRHVASYQVVLGHKREKSAASEGVPE